MDAVTGFGVLQPFLDDPTVEELWINAPGAIYAVRGGESELTPRSIVTSRRQKLDEVPVRDHKVPLALLATEYASYSATPAPTGNVMFIDPLAETTFLDSLPTTGLIQLMVQAEQRPAQQGFPAR